MTGGFQPVDERGGGRRPETQAGGQLTGRDGAAGGGTGADPHDRVQVAASEAVGAGEYVDEDVALHGELLEGRDQVLHDRGAPGTVFELLVHHR